MTDKMKKQSKDVEEPDWGQLFPEPVLNVKRSSRGYANDVWIVQTEKSTFVVKATREPRTPDRPFWDGMLTLFGLDVYERIPHRRELVDFLDQHTPLSVPHALHIDLSERIFPRPFVVYERLSGKPPASLFESQTLATDLGEHLGSLHESDFPFWGSYPAPPSFALNDWPHKLADSLETLSRRWFHNKPEVMEALPGFAAQAGRLPALTSAALILPDLRPSQFLAENDHLSALVDIESHVLGPRELDFVALEYTLSKDDVQSFKEGYTRHLPLPDLDAVRPLYRYLYWVMAALGWKDYRKWMDHPTLFG
jgi:aminoglycoside phosphotransferase (APT) family kinase protein